MKWRLYSDGSCNDKKKVGSASLLILNDNKLITAKHLCCGHPINSGLAAEFYALYEALAYFKVLCGESCTEDDRLDIHVDNLDVFKFVRSCLKYRNDTLTKEEYDGLFNSLRNRYTHGIYHLMQDIPIQVKVHKDAGHSTTITPNCVVDRLAHLAIERM